jgi:class 3 adenylate cyclase/tetratricopeptide (TPR) repeat protein
VTVIFTDVTGSTPLAEALDPEPFRELMDLFFRRMTAVIDAHGGTVEKYIGDAVMAVFGIPEIHEDDPLRAVRAAMEMQGALVALNEEIGRWWGVQIQTRTGVNTGPVVAGDPSTDQAFATGDTVNVAARLEQIAEPGSIVISGSTHRQVRDAVKVEELGGLSLKGVRGPVEGFRLVEVIPDVAGRARGFDSPMVDRDRDRSMLQQAFDRVASDRVCQLFTVLGPPGVGKSRVAMEFTEWCGDRATSLQGRCLPYGEGITFWPLAGVVGAAAGITDADPQQRVREKIAGLLTGTERGELVAERVAQAIGAAGGTAPAEETLWAARLFLESLARDRPLVVVFDDIHWAEPTFLDLVEHVADWSRDTPIMLLCLARPELLEVRPGWAGGKFNATTIMLEPLLDEDGDALVVNLLGARDAAPEIRGRIVAASGGFPLVAEEIVSVLIDDGMLEMEGNRWVPRGDFSTLSIPPTISGLIAARLDRLTPAERTILDHASVIGEEFTAPQVQALMGADGAMLDADLASLLRKDLLRPSRSAPGNEESLRFRHILVRDVAYDSMPKRLRADLHERFADYVEAWAGDRIEAYEEVVASHLERAHRHLLDLAPPDDHVRNLAARAGTRFASAGRRAFARGDMAAATKLLGEAASLLPEDDPSRLKILPDLGSAMLETGDFSGAEAVLDEAIERAGAGDLAGLEGGARLILARVHAETNPQGWMELEPAAERAIPMFEQLGDQLGLARAWQAIAHDRHVRWQMGAAKEARERAAAYARAAGDRREEIEILTDLCSDIQWGPTPAEEGIALLESISTGAGNEPTLDSKVMACRAGLEALLGRFDEARANYERARSIREELGMRLELASLCQVACVVEMAAERPDVAERELRRARDTLQTMGDQATYFEIVDMLAQAVYAQGRYDEADELATITERAGMHAEDPSGQIGWRRIRAKVLARAGKPEEAERLAREAVEIVASTDMTNDHADTVMDLAEVLALAGRADDAAAAITQAVELYERKGNAVSAERARERIGAGGA